MKVFMQAFCGKICASLVVTALAYLGINDKFIDYFSQGVGWLTPGIVRAVFLIIAAFILVIIFMPAFFKALNRHTKQFPKKSGLEFDFTGFIGGHKMGPKEPIIISCFQMRIKNKKKKYVTLEKGYLQSMLTGQRFPLKIKTQNKGYVEFNELNSGIAPHNWFYAQILFYTPGNKPEGLPYSDFINQFGESILTLVKNGKEINVRRFSVEDIEQQLKISFPEQKARPVLVAK